MSEIDVSIRPITVRGAEARRTPLAHRPVATRRRWTAIAAAVDGTMLAVASATAALGSHAAGIPVFPIGWMLGFCAAVLILFRLRGMYGARLRLQALDDVRGVLAATALAAMAVISLRALVADDPYLVGQVVRQWAFASVYLAVGRIGLAWAQASDRRRRASNEPTLIIGAGRVGRLVAKRLVEHPEFGLKPVGFLDKEPLRASGSDGYALPILGASWDLEDVVATHGVRNVVLTFSTAPHQVLLGLVERCERLGIGVYQVPRLFEKVTNRLTIEHLGGLPLLAIDRADPRGWQFDVKYLVDRAVAAMLIIVLLPVLALAGVATYVSLGGPVLFRQVRVGLDGRPFKILKFRSMRMAQDDGPDAPASDTTVADVAPGGVEGADRRTAVGAFLRKTSLDELPQLVNVLKGDMSLVGPRPERPEYAELFEQRLHRYDERHRVKSGITGWAQVHGLRGNTSLADRVEWDNYYIENWSLWLDLKILLMTIAAVVQFRES